MPSWCCTRSRDIGGIECRQGGGAQFIYWQLKTKKRALASHASKHSTQQLTERAPRHALLPIQDQRRVGAWQPYAYKRRVRAISHACAFHRSSSARTRLPHACTRSLVPRPPRPKWTCTWTHGCWCGAGTAWSEVITLLTVMMFNLKGWWSTCTSCAGQDGTGPV